MNRRSIDQKPYAFTHEIGMKLVHIWHKSCTNLACVQIARDGDKKEGAIGSRQRLTYLRLDFSRQTLLGWILLDLRFSRIYPLELSSLL